VKVSADIRLRHGVIDQLCKDAGSVKEFAKLIGVSYAAVIAWRSLRGCPREGSEAERLICELASMEPSEVFPPELRKAVAFFRENPHRTAFSVTKDVPTWQLNALTDETFERNLI
jgi:hypothetical protein